MNSHRVANPPPPPKPAKFQVSSAAQQSNNASVDQTTQSLANNPFMMNNNSNNNQSHSTPAAASSYTTTAPSPASKPSTLSNNPFLNMKAAPAPAAVPPPQQFQLPARPAPSQYSAPAQQYSAPVPLGQSNFTSDPELSSTSQALSAKFPYFSASEVSTFHRLFSDLDSDNHGWIHQSDLGTVSNKAGEAATSVVEKLQKLKLIVGSDGVTLEAFLAAVSELRRDKGISATANKGKIVLHGSTSENTTHTINEDEKQSFTEHINQVLANDKDIRHRLPIDPLTMQVFGEVKDGLILAKLINDSVPNTIDERVLNLGKKLNTFQMTENNNVVVNSAKAIGCSVVNIGAQDLIEGREHLALGLIWQIIKIGLQARVDIKFHPELFRLLEDGESLEQFLKLPVEQILLRWFNYHLKRAGWGRRVQNFSADVKDGENYTVLMAQLAPHLCDRSPLQTRDLHQRAEQVLQNSDRMHCRKYLSVKTLLEGNAKLNFAFVANLFNNWPGLEKLSDAEKAQLDDSLFNSEGTREARAFALWLNSLGVDPFVNNLFDDLQDGLVLLQAIDKVRPGLVDWKKVNKPAPIASKFKKVENTNYVIALGKELRFTLVGIQGSDITDGQKTLTLGLVWQLMREHVIQTLKSLSKSGTEITENDIIAWANNTVKVRSGKFSSISQFKDPNLRTGVFLLDLLNGIQKGVVDYTMVGPGHAEEDALMNAKYAISIARKLGATIFVLPEDIVEVKPKMILTFVGTLMALDKSGTLNH
ncbi:calponin homology domain-containing protein [Obelidium mucronatum]|nr:calponin homology domain-containing protein [Obelidium mucronatum]